MKLPWLLGPFHSAQPNSQGLGARIYGGFKVHI